MMNEADVEKFFRDRFKGTPLYIESVLDRSVNDKDDHVEVEIEFKVLYPGAFWEKNHYSGLLRKPIDKADLEVEYNKILRHYIKIVKGTIPVPIQKISP